MTSFSNAFETILALEGGYVNDPHDPGGETKFGISKSAFPHLDIKSLTIDQAKEIYRQQYWNPIRGDDLPPLVAIPVFDFAVNAGVYKAKKTLQKAMGILDDGSIGPLTLETAQKFPLKDFLVNFTAERVLHYSRLASFPIYGRGWINRAMNIAIICLSKGEKNG